MRIVFMGSPDFAVPSLEALLARHEVVLVVTQPDKPAGRGAKLTPPAVKLVAERAGVPVLQPASARKPEVAEALITPSTEMRTAPLASSRVSVTWCHWPSLIGALVRAEAASPAWMPRRPWSSMKPQKMSLPPAAANTATTSSRCAGGWCPTSTEPRQRAVHGRSGTKLLLPNPFPPMPGDDTVPSISA